MNARISKISLTVFLLMIVLSAFSLSVAGENWSFYAIASVFAVTPMIFGPRRYRIWGTAAVIFSIALILGDIAAGRRLRDRKVRIRSVRTTIVSKNYNEIVIDGTSTNKQAIAPVQER